MTDYWLDTNHVSRLLEGEGRLLSQLQAAEAGGDRFGITPTILGELYFAVYASRRQAENLRRLSGLAAALNVYPFDAGAAEEFGRIQAEQRLKGRPIPPLDAQIAAVARRQGLTVLTADRHFDFVDNLPVANWLV